MEREITARDAYTTSENGHYPLPWHLKRTAVYDGIYTEDDALVAFVAIEPPPACNARYLVKAANAHEAMIDALLEVLAEHDDPMNDYGTTTHTANKCRAAIRLAEKE